MEDTVIFSCLQGHMGRAWTDNKSTPGGALIQTGDFCFLAGDISSPGFKNIIRNIPVLTGLKEALIITDNKDITEFLVSVHTNVEKISRYAIKKNTVGFPLEKLREFVKSLPKDYRISPITAEWYDDVIKNSWSKDFVSNFQSKEEFLKKGIGRIVIYKDIIVSGASSYTVYDDGIEIEIVTHPDYRRLGLARAAGAALLLACIDKGLYPSWDAANMSSVKLAEQLGYEYSHTYDTYVLRG
jgi:GNAT superfamily N-acetyltransferase